MVEIPEHSLPTTLRWLILTRNAVEALPVSIGRCTELRKCMLAGNRLRGLPAEMAACQKLALLRLSANRIEAMPDWLFALPELAFLSFAGNPCEASGRGESRAQTLGLAQVRWSDIEIQNVLGEGASGVIFKGVRKLSGGIQEEVAVKIFRGELTSDGTSHDEMEACMSAGSHENLIRVLGRIHDHPDSRLSGFQGGLVMELIPPHYANLGFPPTLMSCTRDHYDPDAVLSTSRAVAILSGIASAAQHLHASSLAHGDLYAHNILTTEHGHALLGDMGAATIYDRSQFPLLEKLEILAFSHLVDDVMGLMSRGGAPESDVAALLRHVRQRCSVPVVGDRPSFADVEEELRSLARRHGSISRLPN